MQSFNNKDELGIESMLDDSQFSFCDKDEVNHVNFNLNKKKSRRKLRKKRQTKSMIGSSTKLDLIENPYTVKPVSKSV